MRKYEMNKWRSVINNALLVKKDMCHSVSNDWSENKRNEVYYSEVCTSIKYIGCICSIIHHCWYKYQCCICAALQWYIYFPVSSLWLLPFENASVCRVTYWQAALVSLVFNGSCAAIQQKQKSGQNFSRICQKCPVSRFGKEWRRISTSL